MPRATKLLITKDAVTPMPPNVVTLADYRHRRADSEQERLEAERKAAQHLEAMRGLGATLKACGYWDTLVEVMQ